MNIKLKCSCGAVQGVALDITPANGNRVVCCCDDCQRFANHLESKEKVLDAFGGTEIFQTSQSQVKINKGQEHLRCLRLSSKGLNRWYTDCCNTPIGNTLNAGLPLIGLIHTFMRIQGNRINTLGPVRAYVQTKHALGTPTYPKPSKGFPPGITLRMIRKIAQWKIRGMNKPSAFFDDDGQPIVEPVILQ